ncbi:lamin tail domain-containing protein [Tenacibaculum sp. S7007]|uniref:Lamin tail domain-containing protein n=1 Tax=Tenacibaculum pelagium TaxID=2759527 RepID=A0A839APB2_9FLAO|nr:DUF5689 domain-containing protein [Tenacibaculum pelagium]MBA6156922.1 lamin tail domain-containing protein [Tenacibaculum pelagium]
MKKINLYKIFAILFIALSTGSCVDNNDFELPMVGEDKQYENLKTLSEIAALYNGDNIVFNEEINTFGYVISDDREGNFFKTLIIQDKPEDPTIGFEIRIDATNVNAIYNVGRKVYIKLNGLVLGKYFENFQIGANDNGNVDRIDELDYRKHIERSSEIVDIVPTKLTIGELTESHINTLVEIDDVQSEERGVSYANPDNTFSVNRNFKSCATFETIIMRTSGFANFKSNLIPDMKGNITGIVGKFRNDYQIYIRDTEDVDLTQEYGCNNNPTAATLAEIKDLYTGSETTITQNSKIKIVITSDLSKANTSNQNAFGQDATAGIALRFSSAYDLNLGDEIEVAVGGLKLSEFRGLLQLNLSTSDILGKTTGTLPTPEVITIAQALTGDYQGKLVSIEGVQFKDITKTYSGNNELTSDCDDVLTTFVSSSATFAGDQVSDKKGTITGVMSAYNTPQIYIRDTTDVNFTEDYACGSTTPTGPVKLFFSEYAEGSSNNKYLEIYNPSTENVDLTAYAYPNVSNAPTTVGEHEFWNEFPAGATIAPGGVYIIAHGSANAEILGKANHTFNFLSNGDDGFALVHGTETSFTVLDRVGDWNGDPGTGWEVAGIANATQNHTLVRKSSITEGNADWTASAGTNTTDSEWEVKDIDDFTSLGSR